MEKYLHRCLDSLIIDEEEMKQLEVLVINDGSKDSSSQIAHEYQDKYPNTFRVIDKENGNYGSCINRGLKEATGKYVKVLDADDWFDKFNLRMFIPVLSTIDADLILTDYNIVDDEEKIKSEYRYENKNIHPKIIETIDDITQISPTFYGAMHGFTYRLQLLHDMEYKQSEGLAYTDQEWVNIPFTRVQTIYYCPLALYQYLFGREGQTMDKNVMSKSIGQLMTVVLRIADFIEFGDYSKKTYRNYLISQLSIQLYFIYRSGICNRTYPNHQLIEFDRLLSAYSSIYILTNDFVYAKYKYVKDWRENNCCQLSFIGKCFVNMKEFKTFFTWGK